MLRRDSLNEFRVAVISAILPDLLLYEYSTLICDLGSIRIQTPLLVSGVSSLVSEKVSCKK